MSNAHSLKKPTPRILTLAVGLAALIVSGASAQDELGDGTILDANLSPGSRRNVTLPDTSIEYRLRNLEVTGNVAGGRGFRGTVGYTAAGDFRGKLGSNRLYRFMAGSAYSSPDFIRYRDRFEQVELGQTLGLVEYQQAGGGVVGLGQPSYFERPDYLQRRESFSDHQLRVDQLTMQQSLDNVIDGSVMPSTVGSGMREYQGLDARYVITSSEVEGMRQRWLSEQMLLEGMPVTDRLGLANDLLQGYTYDQLTRPFELSIEAVLNNRDAEQLGGQNAVADQSIDLSVNAGINNQYQNIIELMNQSFRSTMGADESQPEEMSEDFTNRYRSLVDLMEQLDAADAAEAENQEDESGDDEGSDAEGDDANAGGGGARPIVRQDQDLIDEMAQVLRHGGIIDSLTTDNDSHFNTLMQEGVDHIQASEYLWAERKFSRALRMSANHPLAMVGKAHAQVGAGLFNSAGLTLHMVFKRSPEVIDVRFAPNLLPNEARLNECTTMLRDQINAEQNPLRKGRLGLLLAYLGHQDDDDAMVNEGLAVLRESTPRDAVLPLAERLWSAPE